VEIKLWKKNQGKHKDRTALLSMFFMTGLIHRLFRNLIFCKNTFIDDFSNDLEWYTNLVELENDIQTIKMNHHGFKKI